MILSIENHCSIEQQKIMAEDMRSIFGCILSGVNIELELSLDIGKLNVYINVLPQIFWRRSMLPLPF